MGKKCPGKMPAEADIGSSLVPLEPLDLAQCQTVGQLVRAMRLCSFGARMLGDVANTLWEWAKVPNHEGVTFLVPSRDPSLFNAVANLANSVNRTSVSGCTDLIHQLDPVKESVKRLVVVGRFSGTDECAIYAFPGEVIFINEEDLYRPGQIRDGHFPNVVFGDPCFLAWVIGTAINEWQGYRRPGFKNWSVTELFAALAHHCGQDTEVVRGARVLKAMVDDPDCTVFMTAAGAMTVAQLDYLFCDMIEQGMIQYLAATGALVGHGLVKGAGCKQYKHNPRFSDQVLGAAGLNRITDSVEPEINFDHIDKVMNEVLSRFDGVISPSVLYRAIGQHLVTRFPNNRGILKSAFQCGVPICTPAFTDSELGNDVFCHNASRERQGRPRLLMDMELDTHLLMNLALGAKKMGIFSVGAGVPGNNTRNVAPLIDIFGKRLELPDKPVRRYSYSLKLAPDKMRLGHFGGCTGSEMQAWNKAWSDAQLCDVHEDATIVWPFILKWAMENRAH